MDRLIQLLAETVLRANITCEEVEMAERSIRFELQALERSPPVDPILTEIVHAAAFRANSTLGLPRYCPEENLGLISRDHIINFMATYYRYVIRLFCTVHFIPNLYAQRQKCPSRSLYSD